MGAGGPADEAEEARAPAEPRRPRVVHVYKDIWPPVQGGIERVIHDLARGTREEFEVGVITAARGRGCGRRRMILGDVAVEEVASIGRALSTPLAPGFVAAMRRSGADLIHFHVPHPTGEVAWLAARMLGLRVPAVATYHSDVVRQRRTMALYGPLFQRFLRSMRVIMPTSERYLETSEPLRGHRERCRVVPLGLPLAPLELDAGGRRRMVALREQHGDFVLFLGVLRAYKAVPVLLEALARVPRVRGVIAGDGPLAAELKVEAVRLGLGGRVVFLGRVDEAMKAALLHAAAMLVLPSTRRSEAFGLVQVEAMACGCPVISCDLPTGVPEVNRHGVSGLIVPPGDAAALAGAIGTLLMDPARRTAMGEAGRRRARENYTDTLMAERVAGVYREVLGMPATL